MTFKQLREAQKAEAVEFMGRIDFPQSRCSPRTDQNSVPLYVVAWTWKDKPTGNSWTSRKEAERVRDKKIKEGTFLYTKTTWCAGFIF